jgi:tetratricopeptide (TPR) repeat protein
MSIEVANQPVIDEEAIGINVFTDMYINSIKHRDNSYEISNDTIVKTLLTAVEINPYSQWAHQEIAIHYECSEKKYADAEKYYLQALELDPTNVIVLYNFAKFYETTFNHDEMIRYFKLASENEDSESCIELSNFYKNTNNTEENKKYLLNAIEFGYVDDDYTEISIYNKIIENNDILYLVDLLENVGVSTVNQASMLNRLKKEKDMLIFNNKVRLFSKFENIIECGICIETKLNIDLHCGHEVCIDCYKQVYLKRCPFCRTRILYALLD